MNTKSIALIVAALLSGNAMAHQAGDWIVRAGVTNVAPNDDSGDVFAGGSSLGGGVAVDSNAQLGLNFAYMVNDNWAIELLAATPFSHDLDLYGIAGLSGPLGETKHLPPTLSANYYFGQPDAQFQPYVGVGLNYTIFFSEDFTAANQAAGFSDLDLDASFGVAAQVGFDYKLEGNWHLNGSVRYIDISTDATFDVGGAAGAVTVDIDPTVYTLSLGYTF